MQKHIATKKGLETLLKRYKDAGVTGYWIQVIEGCIKDGLAMDETDYENTPQELKKLWVGLN